MHMQAAFFFSIVFPPPAAGAEIFSRPDGSRTWSAADANKSTVVQNVVGNVVFVDIVFYFFCCPMQQWVIFDDLVCFVPFNLCHVVTIARMFSADPGYPD